ncbi:MAG: hypothetical protein ACLGIJ_03995 [Candidatus Limnocylindria bacterium]
MSARCRCSEVEALAGDDGIAYARDHLRLASVAQDGWSAGWICPETGVRWHETYRPAWRSGDPGERLERLDQPATTWTPATSASHRYRDLIPRWAMAAVALTLVAALLVDSL